MPVSDYLIETTILVDVFRGKPEAITWVDSVPVQGRWVSVITVFELLAGCRNRREQRVVGEEMRNYHLLLLTEESSRTALSWFERFFLSHGVGFLDSLIAATAVHRDLPIATLNTKHFEPLPGVRVIGRIEGVIRAKEPRSSLCHGSSPATHFLRPAPRVTCPVVYNSRADELPVTHKSKVGRVAPPT
jgi:hypothetical protein